MDGVGGAAAEGVLWTVLEGSGLPGPDQVMCELGTRRRPTSFHVQDPVLRGWWLLWSIVAFWLGVLPVLGAIAEASGVLLRRREVDEAFGLFSTCILLRCSCTCVLKLCILAII